MQGSSSLFEGKHCAEVCVPLPARWMLKRRTFPSRVATDLMLPASASRVCGVASGGFAVGDVEDDGRKAVAVAGEGHTTLLPARRLPTVLCTWGCRRSLRGLSTAAVRFPPPSVFRRAACAAHGALHRRRQIPDRGSPVPMNRSRSPAGSKGCTPAAGVSENGDVEVIPYSVVAPGAVDEFAEQHVDDAGDRFGLSHDLPAEPCLFGHGAGAVAEDDECRPVFSGYLCLVHRMLLVCRVSSLPDRPGSVRFLSHGIRHVALFPPSPAARSSCHAGYGFYRFSSPPASGIPVRPLSEGDSTGLPRRSIQLHRPARLTAATPLRKGFRWSYPLPTMAVCPVGSMK